MQKRNKSYTVYVGKADCKRREDCHSTRTFSNWLDAHAYMWAMAQTPKDKQACWLFCGADGWYSNHIMIGKCCPDHMCGKVAEFVQEHLTSYYDANTYELDITIRPYKNGNFELSSKAMDCNFPVKEIDPHVENLREEYRQILMADLGNDDVKVMLKFAYTINNKELNAA